MRYVTPSDVARFTAPDFPVVGHYAFPADLGGAVHVSPGGLKDYEIDIDPTIEDVAGRYEPPSDSFIAATREVLDAWVPELAGAGLARQNRCFYPVTRHGDYLLDRVGNLVMLVACSSGTGFKTAPVAAEIGAALAQGEDTNPFHAGTHRLEHARSFQEG